MPRNRIPVELVHCIKHVKEFDLEEPPPSGKTKSKGIYGCQLPSQEKIKEEGVR